MLLAPRVFFAKPGNTRQVEIEVDLLVAIILQAV